MKTFTNRSNTRNSSIHNSFLRDEPGINAVLEKRTICCASMIRCCSLILFRTRLSASPDASANWLSNPTVASYGYRMTPAPTANFGTPNSKILREAPSRLYQDPLLRINTHCSASSRSTRFAHFCTRNTLFTNSAMYSMLLS